MYQEYISRKCISGVYFLFQLKSLQLVSFMKQQRKAHGMLQFRNAGSWNVFKIKFNGEMGVNSSLKWPKPPIKSQLPISVHRTAKFIFPPHKCFKPTLLLPEKGSLKSKNIFQSEKAEPLEELSTFQIEESTALNQNKYNQKAKTVICYLSGFILKEVLIPFRELLHQLEKLPGSL